MKVEEIVSKISKDYQVLSKQIQDLSKKIESDLVHSKGSKEYLDINEVMLLTKYAKQTLYGLINSGDLKSHKFGDRQLRFIKGEVEEWILNRTKPNN